MDHNTIANGTLTWSNSSDAFFGPPLTGTTSAGTVIAGGLTLNNNTCSMNQQVKVAVFQVTRNEKEQISSSKFINEFWVEKKPGTSVDFAIARLLGDKYEADQIVIKEIFTVTL